MVLPLPWFFEDPDRLVLETERIEALREQPWFDGAEWRIGGDGLLTVEVLLTIQERRYEVELVYPRLFPTSPGSVFPLDREASWSIHQYSGGELCLEWGPDNWHPDVTGADLLESTHRLLVAEGSEGAGGPPVPSRHQTSFGQDLRSTTRRFILDWMSEAELSKLQDGTVTPAEFRIRFGWTPFTILMYLDGIGAKGTEAHWKNPCIPAAVLAEGYSISGSIVATSDPLPTGKSLSADELSAVLEGQGHSPELVGGSGPLCLLWAKVGGDRVLASRTGDSSDPVQLATTVSLEEPDPVERVPPEFSLLREKSVAVIGIGSAGSKIAESFYERECQDRAPPRPDAKRWSAWHSAPWLD